MRLIVDANVVIDYARTDPSILTLCANHLGAVYIPTIHRINPRFVTSEILERFEAEMRENN